jgi:hypothetical protein
LERRRADLVLGSRSSQFGRAKLHISARDFTKGFTLPRSIIPKSFGVFGGLHQQRPNYWVSAVFRRAQPSLKFQSFEEQILVFQLETSEAVYIAPIYHSTEFCSIWSFQQQGRNIGSSTAIQEGVTSARGVWT